MWAQSAQARSRGRRQAADAGGRAAAHVAPRQPLQFFPSCANLKTPALAPPNLCRCCCVLVLLQKALPANVEQQLVGLLAQFKEARAAADAAAQEAAERGEEEGGYSAEGGYRQQQQQQQQQQQRGPVHYLKQKPADAEERLPVNPLLVVFNAVLNGLVELGCVRSATRTADGPGVLLHRCCRLAAPDVPLFRRYWWPVGQPVSGTGSSRAV